MTKEEIMDVLFGIAYTIFLTACGVTLLVAMSKYAIWLWSVL